ncbi:hypothetical protein CH330_04955 [candidate division WOR-3 bacterium JGI_Cruoil_03_51_56]|uniref:Uncharacterized protein n=1 Tax=candidate division WOR-3 bacterium JGI_Cruoil_03_51_56 TaxID=1973747 RepID=A0A235BVC0_UNCW3|nr:MAG: hypothetical protein CH330_04955 [candidate division WOR-3 bacterium JGI_Cruoil_03_51_56]
MADIILKIRLANGSEREPQILEWAREQQGNNHARIHPGDEDVFGADELGLADSMRANSGVNSDTSGLSRTLAREQFSDWNFLQGADSSSGQVMLRRLVEGVQKMVAGSESRK